mmetsp:Transcript_27312/g.88207  ORF Transcript_27312/g.88207 Transcript_27312/m.88207 type:complete len:217 (-) Transcript_27312:645-1295(-)
MWRSWPLSAGWTWSRWRCRATCCAGYRTPLSPGRRPSSWLISAPNCPRRVRRPRLRRPKGTDVPRACGAGWRAATTSRSRCKRAVRAWSSAGAAFARYRRGPSRSTLSCSRRPAFLLWTFRTTPLRPCLHTSTSCRLCSSCDWTPTRCRSSPTPWVTAPRSRSSGSTRTSCRGYRRAWAGSPAWWSSTAPAIRSRACQRSCGAAGGWPGSFARATG